jgi:hypothetical protein
MSESHGRRESRGGIPPRAPVGSIKLTPLNGTVRLGGDERYPCGTPMRRSIL